MASFINHRTQTFHSSKTLLNAAIVLIYLACALISISHMSRAHSLRIDISHLIDLSEPNPYWRSEHIAHYNQLNEQYPTAASGDGHDNIDQALTKLWSEDGKVVILDSNTLASAVFFHSHTPTTHILLVTSDHYQQLQADWLQTLNNSLPNVGWSVVEMSLERTDPSDDISTLKPLFEKILTHLDDKKGIQIISLGINNSCQENINILNQINNPDITGHICVIDQASTILPNPTSSDIPKLWLTDKQDIAKQLKAASNAAGAENVSVRLMPSKFHGNHLAGSIRNWSN